MHTRDFTLPPASSLRKSATAGLLARAVLLLILPAPVFAAPGDEARTDPTNQPSITLITKVSQETAPVTRFKLLIEPEANGFVHITVIFLRHERDHLSAVALEVIDGDKKTLRLPVKVTVDNTGDDRSTFSTSTVTAALCFLSVEIGPRYPARNELRIESIYRIELVGFLPTEKPADSEKKPSE